MQIKKIIAKKVKDSRGEKTISVIVKTSKGKFVTSSPSGKSKGKFEVKSYVHSSGHDVKFVNRISVDRVNKIIDKHDTDDWISVLKDVEKLVGKKIGGNSLFALESSLLKAIAKENKKELWRFLRGRKVKMRSVGNAIGGGLHSRGFKGKKPDFQEFLFIADCKSFKECVKVNEKAYKSAGRVLRSWRKNDEGAWEAGLSNEQVFIIMKKVQEIMKEKGLKVDIGIDVASSSFYNKGYSYKNPKQKLDKKEQINYIYNLIRTYGLFYVEDALEENDFSGFAELKKKVGKDCLIVGDDLTVTNPVRLRKAMKMKSINAVIVKPNQIGSLLKVREVIEIAEKHGIKTIISHRSGETKDDTIADLGVGFGCDFIKTGIYGSIRKSKLKRLVKIEKDVG